MVGVVGVVGRGGRTPPRETTKKWGPPVVENALGGKPIGGRARRGEDDGAARRRPDAGRSEAARAGSKAVGRGREKRLDNRSIDPSIPGAGPPVRGARCLIV